MRPGIRGRGCPPIAHREACMTTPPDFGGLEIEKGAQEDLGVPPEEHADLSEQDRDRRTRGDNEAHAPGKVCERCGSVFAPGQDVRRKTDGEWVHEVCPAI